MTYTSLNFIFFVLATALVYFVLPFKKYRWTVLLAASIFFYCTWSYQLGAFMLFTTLSTYLIALWLNRVSVKSKAVLKEHKSEWSRDDKKKYKNKTKVRMRLVMTLALLLNFGILAFLKYYNFFAGSLNDILGAFSLDFSAPSLKLILPLGISFYTFQSMGYIVDVYREKTAPQKNPLKLLLFVSFFPQIIQGPISIYDQLAVQLFEGHDFDFTRFKHGCELIMWGFFKKLVIADRAVIAITAVTADYNKFGGTTLTFTVLLYALQLYADFSGGIDISRGVAQIFGVDMIDNFKRPYFSRSINEYWRRWHISLGAWLKNYLFYPVAMSNAFITASKKMKGTRFGKTAAGAHISKVLPTSVASLIVFLVVGIWHGASIRCVERYDHHGQHSSRAAVHQCEGQAAHQGYQHPVHAFPDVPHLPDRSRRLRIRRCAQLLAGYAHLLAVLHEPELQARLQPDKRPRTRQEGLSRRSYRRSDYLHREHNSGARQERPRYPSHA